MAKGENIFRRRDGRWEARYSKGRELSGKSSMDTAMEKHTVRPKRKQKSAKRR